VPRFVKWALAGEPIRIYGTGKQSRCFCFVEDLVEAVIALMRSQQASGKVFNVGSVEEITIEQLADRVIAIAGSKSPKQHISYEQAYGRPIEDMMRRVPDIGRLKQTVGWEPTTNLDETLRIIIEHYRQGADND
jgi:UDP-glucose 4-epimerase